MTSLQPENKSFESQTFKYLIIAALTGYVVWFCHECKITDNTYTLMAALNSLVCGWYLFSTRVGRYTLNKMVNLFILIFFILANAIQYGDSNVVLTFSLHLSAEDFQNFQFLVFLNLIVYNTLYFNWSNNKIPGKFFEGSEKLKISDVNLISASAIATMLVFIYFQFNFNAIFMRGYLEEFIVRNSDAISQTDNLLFEKIIRPIPVACLLISLLTNTAPRLRIILFVFAIVADFPMGLSRNAVAIYWLPIFIALFDRYLRKNRMVWVMIIGMLIIFPYLDNFRDRYQTRQVEISMEYLNTMNYDASQIYMATIKTQTITYGRQLLGVLLFFVPRSLWPNKPIGSGYFLTEQNGASFNNVSMPYFSEGFINFGWFGVLLFTVVLAWFTAKIDIAFWNAKAKGSRSYKLGYYLILLGAVIFIMRGDLMSSFSYTLGTLFSYWIAYKCCQRKLSKSPTRIR